MPGWTETHAADVQVMLAEVLAYTADYLAYYQDAIATEAYLSTAQERISVRRHARLVDYYMHDGCNARTWLVFDLFDAPDCPPIAAKDIYFVTKPLGNTTGLQPVLSEDQLKNQATDGSYETFEPVGQSSIKLYGSHKQIEIYTWGGEECCLPKGATLATLVSPRNAALHLSPGDVIVFEERVGPDTGVEEDADLSHRQAVRLTRVTPNSDPLYGSNLVDVEWDPADALTFSLCLTTVGPPPECAPIKQISVVRGNVILVDHGKRQATEDLGRVQSTCVPRTCDADCPDDRTAVAQKFRPALKSGPVTFSQPLDATLPASKQLLQDPRRARADLKVYSVMPSTSDGNGAAAEGLVGSASRSAGERSNRSAFRRRDGQRSGGTPALWRWRPRPDALGRR